VVVDFQEMGQLMLSSPEGEGSGSILPTRQGKKEVVLTRGGDCDL